MSVRTSLLLLLACISASCQDRVASAVSQPITTQTEQKANPMTQDVTIKLNELGADFQKRYPQVRITVQPAGLSFYKIAWNMASQGNVKIDHGKHSFVIEHALGVLTNTNVDLPAEGLYEYSVSAGITAPDLITHDEARDKLYAILRKIEQKGWKIITGRSDPRLKGKERFEYVVGQDSSAGLGTDFLPTLGEWMRTENLTAWEFYADRQYLTVYFKRERTLLDPAKPGSYLLTYTLKSEAEHFRAYVGPDNRARWKELLPAELAPRPDKRAKAEATLKAQGIKIDETYQDPPLPDLK